MMTRSTLAALLFSALFAAPATAQDAIVPDPNVSCLLPKGMENTRVLTDLPASVRALLPAGVISEWPVNNPGFKVIFKRAFHVENIWMVMTYEGTNDIIPVIRAFNMGDKIPGEVKIDTVGFCRTATKLMQKIDTVPGWK